ncbi:class I SAM-dependent methyltransferase [Roseomonas sp. 18066]|uniref:class I SAM-dependent methyltransferase n=1 Tax=Roseomonas sp. 18066 TaxID=2681412 RepID=UPI001359BE6B|nr:class I SAM-dependent methyltransferase [Roseomonas sp. 18066]
MATMAEREAWATLLRRHLGAEARQVLELAFGTGEVTGVLLPMGLSVTGLDLTEAMLCRAKAKHAGAPGLRLFLGDAEATGEPGAAYDAVVSRHLVWTLVDPAAFRDWHRVLRPGGRVVIADGDYVRQGAFDRLRLRLSNWLATAQGATSPAIDWAAHAAIQRQVFFREGLRPQPLRRMLEEAGFTDFRLERPRGPHAAQRRGAPLRQKLRVGIWNSFVLSCGKPD